MLLLILILLPFQMLLIIQVLLIFRILLILMCLLSYNVLQCAAIARKVIYDVCIGDHYKIDVCDAEAV